MARLQQNKEQSINKPNNKARTLAVRHVINYKKKKTPKVYGRTNNNKPTSTLLNDCNKYWMQRSKRLLKATIQQRNLHNQKMMSTESHINLLDVRLMFRKAEHCLHRAQVKVKQLHTRVTEHAEESLKHIPTDRVPIETDVDLAFDKLRHHSSSGEMYFWELSYNTISSKSGQAISVDENGRAHIFEQVHVDKTLNTSSIEPVTSTDIIPPTPEAYVHSTQSKSCTKMWHCNTDLCILTDDSIQGTVNLLLKLKSVNPLKLTDCYLHIDDCSQNNFDRLGHSVHCTAASGCRSLLRPARTLSTHYPRLRSMIRRLYEVRQLIQHIESVKRLMSSGN